VGFEREAAVIQLKIEGMTCNHCVMSVRSALAGVPGVEGPVEVDLKAGEARVGGAPDPAALVRAVEEEGFTASLPR
jgi:copper chaperone